MKVIVDPQELYQVLQAVKKCVPNKATLPALRHVQMVAGLGRLQLAGTDLSSAVVAPVPAEVQEEGEVLVPAKELDQRLAQLRKRAEVITLESPPESWDLTITTETATIPIKGMDPNEYVAINAVTAEELDAAVGEDQPPVGRLAAFEATDLATAIRQVAPAALSGKSASRKSRELWSLTYVWLTGETSAGVVRLMATDTTHLHYVEIPAVVFQNFAVGIHNTTAISLLQGEVTLAGRAKADDDEPGWSLLTL
ncbi:MAG: hypothetical protein JXM73_04630, partial [Anaerolineae bacterium]|nr:hypothetical protein [Anaerolineae bacterium]